MEPEAEDSAHLSELTLKKISIEGYRNLTRPLVLELRDDANFLIGRNGTGKTTLINLVYDILAARYQSLWRAPFVSAEIEFRHHDRRLSPSLSVKKTLDDDGDIVKITYSFKEFKSKGNSFSFTLRSRFYRMRDDPATSLEQRRLKMELERRFGLTWLALNRSFGLESSEGDEKAPGSSEIDRKLANSSRRLAGYFSSLDAMFSSEVRTFQQQWLLSLLVEERKDNIIRRINDLDLEEEKRHLTSMLKELKIPPEDFLPKVDRHIATAKRLASREKEEFSSFSSFTNIYDISKLHSWVERWRALQTRREEIYKYRDKFIDTLNSMLFRKRVAISDRNELLILTDQAASDLSSIASHVDQSSPRTRTIRTVDLSSGEKQLIVFLAETLLREQKRYIFMADEPELSLHIEWQERLVDAIREISPGAQIFFATHSPDIVGRYGANVHKMEALAF